MAILVKYSNELERRCHLEQATVLLNIREHCMSHLRRSKLNKALQYTVYVDDNIISKRFGRYLSITGRTSKDAEAECK